MRTPREVLDRVALWRIDPTSLVRPDEQTTVRRIEVVRGAWGLVMLAGPTPLLRAIAIDDDPVMIWTGRVLGARHLTQAVLSGARPSPEGLAMGVWVDAVHALCALGLAASSRRRAAAGIFDAVAATGWAVAGYRDLVNPRAALPTHTGAATRWPAASCARCPAARPWPTGWSRTATGSRPPSGAARTTPGARRRSRATAPVRQAPPPA